MYLLLGLIFFAKFVVSSFLILNSSELIGEGKFHLDPSRNYLHKSMVKRSNTNLFCKFTYMVYIGVPNVQHRWFFFSYTVYCMCKMNASIRLSWLVKAIFTWAPLVRFIVMGVWLKKRKKKEFCKFYVQGLHRSAFFFVFNILFSVFIKLSLSVSHQMLLILQTEAAILYIFCNILVAEKMIFLKVINLL